MRRELKHRGLRVFVTLLGALSLLVACNAVLGIEQQDTRPAPDDAALEAEAQAVPSVAARCTHDSDCIAPNSCYTPHCDTVLGACTFALCEAKDRTCSAGVCDPKTFACSDGQPYGFEATSYPVPGVTTGCAANPRSCIAAAFPFLFIGTRDDVVALRVDDFLGKTAQTVSVLDLDVRPQQLIASGRRIWVLGPVQGVAPPYLIALAALDVPSDPTTQSLVGRTSVISYPFPTVQGFAAPGDGLFLVYPDAPSGFPTVQLPSLPAEGAKVTQGSTGDAGADAGANGPLAMHGATNVPGASTVVATSGARLVLYRGPGTFNLITSPGTASAITQPDLGLNPGINPLATPTFAQGPDGTVTMSTSVVLDPVTTPPDCNCTSKARLVWLFSSPTETATDPNVFFDPGSYVNPGTVGQPCHTCAAGYYPPPTIATWLDHRSVLTSQPSYSPAGRSVADVRYLGRDPLDANTKRIFTTKMTDTPRGDFTTDRIALTSSSGIGYFVLSDDQGNDVSLSIVDPRCDAR